MSEHIQIESGEYISFVRHSYPISETWRNKILNFPYAAVFFVENDADGNHHVIYETQYTTEGGIKIWGLSDNCGTYYAGGTSGASALPTNIGGEANRKYCGFFTKDAGNGTIYFCTINSATSPAFFFNGVNRDGGAFPIQSSGAPWYNTVQSNAKSSDRTIQTYCVNSYYSPNIQDNRIPGGSIYNYPINSGTIDPNGRFGNSKPGGGKGTRPKDSGKIVNPYSPSIDALDGGFMTAFLPTLSQLNDLASYLWSNPISFESLEKMISNPFDLIIGLHMLPISIASSGTKAIKPGALVSGISAAYTDKQIVTKDFGTLAIAERWGSVLDYAPYTKISIHLPYIGTRTLNTDEVMNKTIGLKYKVDILSGACVAEISVDGSVMYEFAGNMALDIPITAQDHRQLLATLATIGVTAAGAGLAALGGAGAVAGAGAAASEAAGASGITAATVAQVGNAAVGVVMAAKPTIERAGGLGSAAGWCGVQTPYILIESPEQSLPEDYMTFNGYPCNMTFTLSELEGYTQCETVRFGSAHATDPEMQEVIASLQAGVVLGGTAPTKPTDPVAGIGVTLYQNASPALYVYKDITAYGAQHVCNFKQPTDIVNPTITLELSAIDFNYVYIGGSVDRYYYVTEKRSVRRGVWEVELKCDPLMSFASDILAASAVVSRQENEWNLYLDDGTFKAYQYTNFYQEPFGTSFDTSTYVLIVAGS